ncbi:hypothetical protein [Thermogymnomonas acidicola]|uniref:hypothetical protein n=1 Tax=Thermogymnomonas acidicola TaxID=399579 RepID=UPI0009462648|nr:hypothetical protein [Thermogymnomonas acidicola]
MAYAISGEMGWPIVEMNASDQRNRDGVRRVALMASLYRDISGTGTEGLRLILIDEADNFFEGGEGGQGNRVGGDAGGLSELARVLRVSRNPIVITMNDFYEFRRKGAAREVLENSMVIEFKPYRRKNDLDYRSYRQRLTRRLQQIGEEEGIRLSQDQIQAIMDRNGTDIRGGMINDIAGMVASTADVMRRDTKKTPVRRDAEHI